jgi:hypothetical protein
MVNAKVRLKPDATKDTGDGRHAKVRLKPDAHETPR